MELIINILNGIFGIIAAMSIPLIIIGVGVGIVLFIIAMISDGEKRKKFNKLSLWSVGIPFIMLLSSLILFVLVSALKIFV